jgi:hypothetical protein
MQILTEVTHGLQPDKRLLTHDEFEEIVPE